MSISIPVLVAPMFADEVDAGVDAGLYADETAFLADAVRTLLAARPDVREIIACRLYARGIFSIGKAAEWASLSIEQMKQLLHRRGIERTAPETPAETAMLAHAALKLVGYQTMNLEVDRPL